MLVAAAAVGRVGWHHEIEAERGACRRRADGLDTVFVNPDTLQRQLLSMPQHA